MKTVSIFLALVNALLAGLLIAASVSPAGFSRAQVWWSAAKDAAAVVVILVGAITWLGITRPVRAGLIPMCSLLLVALGTSTAVWTLQQALVTGDVEIHMIVYGGSLAAQGMASLFGFVDEAKDVAV